ncbi:hypothetical protein ONE63_007784 [Megalurothrips usitatus]|uniref:Uncharacterized protein n=1 Tax=Megalurothrips usitatus TaxID=439358 RepID=A0AAV7XWD7_9NEOP|nr:hypothetical protein ONE63_007784 [Megalurothrips usitatus]
MEHHGDGPHWVVSVQLADEDAADVYSEYTASYDQDDPYAARRAGLADSWTGVPAPNGTREEVGAREVTLAAMAAARPKVERVPAAVAGLRLPQRKLQQLFEEAVSTLTSCPEQSTSCAETCLSDSLDCYLLDENAIVVVDKTGLEAGRPLARANPDLLLRLELAKVYNRITVNDHQAICRRPPRSTVSDAGGCPAQAAAATPSSCLAGAALAALWWRQGLGGVVPAAAALLGGAHSLLAAGPTATPTKDPRSTASPGEVLDALEPLRVNKTVLHLCVMLRDLHRVGPGTRVSHNVFRSALPRSLVAVAVPGTSLVLVVARKGCPVPKILRPFRTEPYEDVISAENPAVRKEGLLWPRRRPGSCFREHIGELNITQCGAATRTAGVAAPLAALLALAALAVALSALPLPA